MGSFYATDLLTGTTIIDGQKTSIQLLTPSYSGLNAISNANSMIVDNSLSQSVYAPFGFPINGKYADYGNICNIVRDNNTDLLESFFGMSVGELIDYVISNDNKSDDIIDNLKITYFRTEVLDIIYDGVEKKYDLDDPSNYSPSSYIKKAIDKYTKPIDVKKRLTEIENLSESEVTPMVLLEFSKLLKEEYSGEEFNYIKSPVKYNMLKILKLDESFSDKMLKQYHLLNVMGNDLKVMLMPSLYGSQYSNSFDKYKFNKQVNNMLINDIKEIHQHGGYYDSENDEVSKLIKTHNRINKLDDLL
jgi:hypothetical protein